MPIHGGLCELSIPLAAQYIEAKALKNEMNAVKIKAKNPTESNGNEIEKSFHGRDMET